jgi:hypothetical protein
MKACLFDTFRGEFRKLVLGTLAVLLLLFGEQGNWTAAWGQGATSAINGTVTDSSGAVVPDAKVSIKNAETGTEQAMETNSDGRYVFPTLQPGRYSLRIAKQGFATVNESTFRLDVNQTATHDFVMQVGATNQEVTVNATAVNVEASTAELGTAIQTQEVSDLPLNGRNFTQLLALTPGVSPISTGQNSGGGSGFAGNAVGAFTFPSVNGHTNRSNMFLLDGFTDYGFIGNYAVAPIVDAIQEFKVQSHNDSSAYGGSLGGIINVVSAGGTAHYHGDLWEFLRNSDLDARNTFNPSVTPYKQNQFGAAAGGPVIPSFLRKGPPRTFVYAAYEGFRSTRAAETLGLIPTQQELSGNLSDVSSQIYNPFTTRPDPNHPGQYLRDPFPNNQIPAQYLNPGMIAYAKQFYPQPQMTGIPGINYIDTTPNVQTMDTGTLRADQQWTDRLSSWFRLTKFEEPQTSATGLPGAVSANDVSGYQTGISTTWTSGSGNKVATVRFGRTNAFAVVGNQFSGNLADAWKQGGFNPLFTTGFVGSRSFNVGMGINGYAGIPGGQFQGNNIANIWEGAADFTLIKGNHTLQMGTDINSNNNVQPILFVTEGFTSYQTSNLENNAGTGNALASFLMSLPDNTNRRNVNITTHGGWVDGFYFQDQWKLTDKLQVNLGFRYDLTLWPIYGSKSAGNQYVGDTNLDNGTYILAAQPPGCSSVSSGPCIPTPNGALPPHVVLTNSGNGSIIHNSFDNWQPRIGLAYRLAPNTVVRASIGRFYDNWAAIQQLATNYQGNWPDTTFLLQNNLNYTTPNVTAQDPLQLGSGGRILPAPTPFNQVNWMIDPYYKNAYSVQWNFGVQQQLGKSTVIEADYVGSHDSRLDSGAYRDTAVTPAPGPITDRQPFPYITPTYFDKSVAKANYEAFQFKARKTTASGLTLLASYTWSKTINLGCDGFFGSEGCSIQDAYNLKLDRSLAGYDIPQNFSFNWVYEIPAGKGKRVNFSNGFVNAALGNWVFTGIFTARSGQPFNANANGDIANTGNVGSQERPTLTCTNPYAPNPNRNAYLNTSCFTEVPFTFGTEARNDLRTPSVTNLDLSLFKDFPIPGREGMKLQFRSDFFNSLNQSPLGWNNADFTVGDPTFGQLLSTATTEREIQFALKFYF